jgi:hypothetical protein
MFVAIRAIVMNSALFIVFPGCADFWRKGTNFGTRFQIFGEVF